MPGVECLYLFQHRCYGSETKNLAADIPRDHILTETDAPFGKRAGGVYPAADVNEAVELLAKMRRAAPFEIQRHLNGNLRILPP